MWITIWRASKSLPELYCGQIYTLFNGQSEVGSFTCGSMLGGVGSFVHPNELGKIGKALEYSVNRERPSPRVYRQRQKKVIVGREFLLVDR